MKLGVVPRFPPFSARLLSSASSVHAQLKKERNMIERHPLNLMKWIDEHRNELRPPVGNAQPWDDTDLIVTVLGGPNARNDYHDDPHEEFFYQLKGDMVLRVMERDGPRDVPIREGEVYILPPHVPHSPQRGPGTLGLIIERMRAPGVLDAFEWYCDKCHARVHRHELHVSSLLTDIPKVFEKYFTTVANGSCPKCGAPNPKRVDPLGCARRERKLETG